MMMIFLNSLFLFHFSLAQESTYQLKEMTFDNGAKVTVEVADDFAKRSKGLMHRTKMDEDKGMLFIFDQATRQSFWNKNTFLALDLAYFDKDKKLKEVYPLEPVSMMEKVQRTKTYPSQCDCQYVLEVNRGWFKRHKVKVGSRFSLKSKQLKKTSVKK